MRKLLFAAAIGAVVYVAVAVRMLAAVGSDLEHIYVSEFDSDTPLEDGPYYVQGNVIRSDSFGEDAAG